MLFIALNTGRGFAGGALSVMVFLLFMNWNASLFDVGVDLSAQCE
jgi:hypothetical protein